MSDADALFPAVETDEVDQDGLKVLGTVVSAEQYQKTRQGVFQFRRSIRAVVQELTGLGKDCLPPAALLHQQVKRPGIAR